MITKKQEQLITFADEALCSKILKAQRALLDYNYIRTNIIRDATKDFSMRSKEASSNDSMDMALIGIDLIFRNYTNLRFTKKITEEDYEDLKDSFYNFIDRIKKYF